MPKARKIEFLASNRQFATRAFSSAVHKVQSLILVLKETMKYFKRRRIPPLDCDTDIEKPHVFNIYVYGRDCQDYAILQNFSIQSNGLTESEREIYRASIPRDLFEYLHVQMGALWEKGTSQEIEFHSEMADIIRESVKGRYDSEDSYRVQQAWLDKTAEMFECISRRGIRSDTDEVRRIWNQRQECINYFLSDIHRFFAVGYEPTVEDIVLANSSSLSTRGRITHLTLDVEDVTYCFVTQHVMRYSSKGLKWHQRFSTCDGIIFMVDLCEYDIYTSDDTIERENHLNSTLQNFEHYLDLKSFAGKSFILLFSNVDRFKEKLETSKLQDHFPDFNGGDYDTFARDYILNMFVSKNPDEERQIYAHFLSNDADATAWNFVDAAVKDIIASRDGTKFFDSKALSDLELVSG